MAKKDITHGMSNTIEYGTWCDMKSRCYRKTHSSYPWYGAIGIKVSAEWKRSFENFYSDMGTKPEGMSLDRKDSTKGYSFENCRWADAQMQSINRRKRANTKSKFRGVRINTRCKKIRYEAYITVNKVRYNLGSYDTEVEAATAYNNAAVKWRGAYAMINKVGEY